MNVQAIMSSPVVTVLLDDTLAEVRNIFSNTHFHHLLVVENDKLFGVISDRDYFKAISPKLDTAAELASDLATLNKKVHQIMSRKPISMKPNESIYKAVDIFQNNNISCIPIVNEDNIPVGIVSWRDLIKVIERATLK